MTIKIGLIIVLAIGLVFAISTAYGPQKKHDRDLVNDNNPRAFENVPPFLQKSFPNTDFSKSDSVIEKILTGGPAKDGIPAIDQPEFTSLSEFERSDSVQAIVIEDGDDIKVYPYNILTWHEIVNDIANDVPIAITFCPLCGSAIVFDRRTEAGETTFGVSGALIESNMVMYDRKTESLWQQSTGEALAGELFPSRLELYPFQLLTMGEVRDRHPNARILSEDTGHFRNYGRNPYSGYNENDRFFFQVSTFDGSFDTKEIMVVFRVGEEVLATPWLSFEDGTSKETVVGDTKITLNNNNGELVITDQNGEEYPFFYEMWFSFVIQNPDGIVVE